jgi:hypothetical protein
VYGSDGFDLVNDTSAGNPTIPAYATLNVAGAQTFTWNGATTDPHALQKAGAAGNLAACWYGSQFTVNLGLNDNNTHQVALYLLDWDGSNSRAETVTVTDASSGKVLDTQSVNSFSAGKYLVWNIKGSVNIQITNTGPTNAVLSGIFFGGSSSSAAFVKSDTTTQGAWKGVYGADGFDLANDTSAGNPTIPAYATLNVASVPTFTWNGSTTDPRALQKAGTAGNLAACWYGSQFTVGLATTDGNAHQVALYLLDWDGNNTRAETVTITDASSGAVLDTESVTSFSGGKYLVWNIKGAVNIQFTSTGAANAVLSGMFFR